MKILVAGAAGAIGNKLVKELADGGHQVTGLVHSEDKVARVRDAGGVPVVADITDKSTLREPVSNADVVVFAAGSGGKAVGEVDRDGAINLVDAAQDAGVGRFVMLSSMAAGEPDRGPDELRDYLVAKGAADDYLRASSLRHVIVRPTSLTDDGGTGKVRIAATDKLPSGEIARSDVAATLAACTTDDAPENLTFELIAGEEPIVSAVSSLAD
ncbi:SDR family oxidoreductase [Croceicoccus sediminis]|uniref:SDR family oxidoreductase n=1 Tax=Croceicoccus sediminis TaxID=2571150 RepID=UPI001183C40C|nr:SDR family oxidoreductase [Croceicoccus sediminis]